MSIEATKRGTASGYFCLSASLQDRAIFHARALMLQQNSVEKEETKLGLAVLELGGEYFGIELTAVQEFCDINQLSPIPCCPPHILGVMSLRGNLLTLLDPRSAFNLPQVSKSKKAVITRFDEKLMGMAVDEIHDIVYLRREELQPPPAALRQQTGAEIIGTVQYGERVVTVLNLQMLLARQEWLVNENV
jgi:purine-binding chemotaxis protein CheW